MRLLIVDDNRPFLEATRMLLERQGASVVGTATTSAEALALTEELHPDVVLVDVMLGEESGFDLARRLDHTVRVVMISTYAATDFEDLLAETSAVGFLPKSELSLPAILRLLAA